jgi:tetratricopeptide (TPR) repeat protein
VLEATIKRDLGQFYAMAGRSEEALELFRQSSLVLDELNRLPASPLYRGDSSLGVAMDLAGDPSGAEQLLIEMLMSFRESGYRDRRAIRAATQLVNLCCDQDRWEDAERFFAYVRDVQLAERSGEAVIRLAAEARLAAHRGELDEALSLAQRALTAAERSDDLTRKARIWLAFAEVRRARDETADADAAVAAALALYEQKGNIAAAARVRAAAHD